ncbi:MAG: hypothetical protein CMK59_05705, partial [Proteobacteria bacterium]|nr:hypothetical protein [Pseudomonadota bacterium]
MRLISYNILNPHHAVKWKTFEGITTQGGNNWHLHRKEQIISNLKLAQFDVAAVQELSPQTHQELSEHFSIVAFDTHMSNDGEKGLHGTAILLNPKTVKLIKTSIYSTSSKHRVAASCDVRDLSNQKTLRIVSVHLKGYDPYEQNTDKKRKSQRAGDLELDAYIKQALKDTNSIDGVVFMGDFNEDSDEMHRTDSRQNKLLDLDFIWDKIIDITEPRKQR